MSMFVRFTLPVLLLFILFMITFSGCNGEYNPDDQAGSGGGSGSGIQLDLPVAPQVTWKDTNGKTQVILQFSVRDGNGVPLQEDEFDIGLKVDGQPIDVESLLNQSAQELEVNLYFAMVLDASYSMTQHTPPAFEPMKTAARDSYQEILDLWNARPGNIKFSLIWFDELMNQSQYNTNLVRDWLPDDILSIPAPVAGTATKLDSAVKVMADFLKSEYDKGNFNGPRDQYVMLVFSDGADNYSYWDNSSVSNMLNTTTGASYHQFGTAATNLEAAKQAIAAHPHLTIHVIGLGSAINTDELGQLAEAGNGKLIANPSSENIAQLFERVLQEFTTIQTRGAEIPLTPGDYDFTLTVTNKSDGRQQSYTFRMHAGDPQAGVISVP